MQSKFLSFLLAFCMVLSLSAPVFAEPLTSNQEIDGSTGQGTTEVTLEIGGGSGSTSGNGNFSVTVPTILPFVVKNDGTVLTATDGKIRNYSFGPVEVTGVTGSGVNGWSIVEAGTDFTRVQVNAKAFTMSVNDDIFPAAASGNISNLPLTAASWPVISGDSSLPVLYDGSFAVQDSNVNGQIANVVFFVSWHRDPASEVTGLQIMTGPAKTSYLAGDHFDPTGMVVRLTLGDGSYREVSDYTIVNGTSLAYGQTSVTIRYEGTGSAVMASTPITVGRVASGIEITGQPAKTMYDAGEDFDPTGLEITAHYQGGVPDSVVDDYIITNGSGLTAGQTSVTVSYTSGGQTATTDVPIVVNSVVTGDPRWDNIAVGEHVKAGTMKVGETNLSLPTATDRYSLCYFYDEWNNSNSSKNYSFETNFKGDAYWNTEGGTPYLSTLTRGKYNTSTRREPDISAREFRNQAISAVTFFGDSCDDDAYNVEWIKISDSTYVCDRVLFVNVSPSTLSALTNGMTGYTELAFDGHTFKMRLPTYEECVAAGIYGSSYAPCWLGYNSGYYAYGRAGTDGSPYGARCSSVNGGERTWLYENYSGTIKVYMAGFLPVLEMVG